LHQNPAKKGLIAKQCFTVWGEQFRRLIDEERIYGRAQSAEEIRADMSRPVRASCR
jgi:hypothetical protein